METLRRSFAPEMFREKLMGDPRDPLFTFTLPGLEGDWGLFAPLYEHWRQLVLLALISEFLQVLCAILNYHFIISNRGSRASFIFGWGFMIPLATWIPYQMIEYFDLRNSSIKTIPTILPISVVFRTVEAMYETSPPQVETSLMHYMIYYTAGSHHVWDKITNSYATPTVQHMISTTGRLIQYFLVAGLSLSVLLHCNFSPFSKSPVVLQDFHFNLDLFHPHHLLNGYCFAVHTYFHLRFFFHILTFGENVKGFTTRRPFRDPLWSSTSPTDFWNRRWNTVVHDILQGGAFRPARRFFSPVASLGMVFLASGLLHEYAWSVTFFHSTQADCGEDCYRRTPLKLTLFFLWNGLVMLLERPLRHRFPFSWMARHLPAAVKATLVLATALPVSHWFVGDWIVGEFFTDWAPAFFVVRPVHR